MMNSYQFNNEILKSVMEGMGETPSDNMLENWNKIMNFVPDYSGDVSNLTFKGDKIKLIFEPMSGGGPYEIICNEDMPLKEAFLKFAQIAKIPINDINKNSFLCGGKNMTINQEGTIKENNLKNESKIIFAKIN